MIRNFIVFFEGVKADERTHIMGDKPFISQNGDYLNRSKVMDDLRHVLKLKDVQITNIIELTRHDLNTWLK